ncbi:hypothetical protein EPO14_04115 [Patescibacteria group bacterium]|nr:MAG: hypothetical protein EPO14_04115 [Patescibacteria group bacterium]
MKKVFLILLLTITLAGFVVPSHLAFAGEAGESGAAGGLATVAPEAAAAQQTAEATYSAQQGAAGAAIANSPGVQRGLDVAIDCASAAIPIFGAAKADDCLASIIRVFTSMLLKLAEVILYFVGLFLNFFVEQLVVNMGSFVTSSDAVGIQIAWRIMRDLANLAIIGGLIATAIGTILHLATINAQKLLVRLIIAALLVNFSFFFAGAIIDSSNFLATTIYRATIQTERCAEACTIVDRFERVIQSPHKNLAEYLQGRVEGLRGGEQDSQWMGVLQDILSVVLIAVTIFVFLSAASLLLGRFVALILILITSPIGIAGMAIPQISKYAKEWWEALFSQAFFAPVYFLLVGFSLTILDNSNGAFSGNDTNLIGGLLTFMVATVFMLQSLKIAKGMSEASKRLTDVYKTSDKLAGWMPKVYTSSLKYMGSSAATGTAGFLADRLGRGYEKWIASDGRIPKLLAGSGIDRGIQKGFQTVADAKFGGKEGYLTRIEEAEKRKTRLGDVKTSQENLKKLKGAGGLVDQHNDVKERKEAVEAKDKEHRELANVIAKEKFKKDFDSLSDKQKNEVMADSRWKDSELGKSLDTLTTNDEKYKGKSWGDLDNKERQDLLARAKEDGRWQGRLWLYDKDKKTWGVEGDWEYRDRLRKDVDLRTKEEREAGKEKITYQSALDQMRSAAVEISYSTLKEEIRRDHALLPKIAMSLSDDQWAQMKADDSISRTIKNEVRDVRLGTIMREARDFEEKVVELDAWKKMSKEKRVGKVLRGSNEYHQFRVKLHQSFKKYENDAEVIDYIESDEGIKNGMRKNKVFIDAVKNSVGQALQKSNKISYGEKRDMRAYKRKRVIDADTMDTEAMEIFEGAGVTSEVQRDAAMAMVTDPITEGTISYEDFEEKLEKLGGTATNEGKIFYAAWLRKRADEQSRNYFEGKSDGEIDSELKQEAYGLRLVGKYMSAEQLMASHKDQAWKDKQALAMAIYGSPETLNWLRTTPSGKSYSVDWEEVAKERARLGLPSVDEIENEQGS